MSPSKHNLFDTKQQHYKRPLCPGRGYERSKFIIAQGKSSKRNGALHQAFFMKKHTVSP